MFAFNVWLNNRLIDTVFYSVGKTETREEAVDSVRKSLIKHDGYPHDIKVTWPKGQRLTRDIYEVHGNYGYGHGFECVTAEDTRKAAKARLKEYRENEPGVPFKIVAKRERI